MVDAFGTQILTGDTVVVSHRRGSSSWLTKATVSALDEYGKPVIKWPSCTRKYDGTAKAIMVVNNG